MITGAAIREKRKALGLSAPKLAELLQVKLENLYKWEKGSMPSNPEEYLRLERWLENVPHGTVQEGEMPYKKADEQGGAGKYADDLIHVLKEQNEFLRRNFEVSLQSIHQIGLAQLAHLKALEWYQADQVAEGDQQKTIAELKRVGSKVAELTGIDAKKDNPVHSSGKTFS